MSNGSAYVFYVRSKGFHRFRSAYEDELVASSYFDHYVMCPANLIKQAPSKATEYIIRHCEGALKAAQS